MRYEWKKFTRSAVFLMIGVVLLNAWLFYEHCNSTFDGFTLAQIEEVFSLYGDALAEKTEAAGGQYLVDDPDNPGQLKRQSLTLAVETRRDFDYAAHVQSIVTDAEFRIRAGLFGDEDSFSVRSLRRTAETYQKLTALRVEPTFSGALEALNGWRLSDVFFLFFGCIPGLFLLTQERRDGLTALLRPTKNGHGVLYLRKFGVMLCNMLLGFLLIYGANLAIAAGLFGLGDLSRPIQSAYGFQNCPVPLTVLGYLVTFYGIKLLWGAAVCVLFFTVCGAVSSVSPVLACGAGAFVLAALMSGSNDLWLRSLSLVRLAEMEELLGQCVYLNFFETPIRQLTVAILFLAALLALCFALGWVAFVRRSAVASVDNGGRKVLHFSHRHTSLFLHEMQKLLRMHGALLLLAAFAAVQLVSYSDYDAPNSQWEYYYRSYSEQLSGAPCEASDRLIAEERARFAEIYEKIADFYEQAGDDTDMAEMMTSALREELVAEEPFEQAAAQYEALGDGQSYVYRSGYERLYGAVGRKEALLELVKWLLFLIAAFSGVFAVERETGVEVLQTTAGVGRKIARRKRVACGVVLFVSFWVAYLPQYCAVLTNYGLPELSAAANSLVVFTAAPDGLSIRGMLLLIGLFRLAVGTAATAAILAYSKKSPNKTTAALLSLGTLLLPAAILYLLA